MNFNKQKQDILKKQDKSKKGDVDEKIQKLTNLINNKKNFYTTSSCSGRIMLLQVSNSGKKNETKWLFVSHNPVAFQEIADTLKNPEGDVWFKQEGMILHILMDFINLFKYNHVDARAISLVGWLKRRSLL